MEGIKRYRRKQSVACETEMVHDTGECIMASVSLNRTKNGFKGSCNHAESDPGSATVHIDAGVKTKPHTHTAEIAISEKLVS